MDLHRDENAIAFEIDGRSLIELGHRYLHPEMRSWYWDDPTYSFVGTYISFDVENQGTVAFCYNAHPVAVKADRRGTKLHLIFDQDYVWDAVPDPSKHYIVNDGRDAIFFEMSPGNQPFFKYDPGTWSFWPKFMRQAYNKEYWYPPARKHYPETVVRLPYAITNEDEWLAVEARGRKILRKILVRQRSARLRALFGVAPLPHPAGKAAAST